MHPHTPPKKRARPQLVPIKQRECLDYLGQVEEAMVKGLSFEVPKEYADRPLLLVGGGGRVSVCVVCVCVCVCGGVCVWGVGAIVCGEELALVQRVSAWASAHRPARMAHTAAHHPARPLPRPQGRATLEMKVDIRETPEGPQSPVLTIVLDGYNAPVSAGQVRCVCVSVCVCVCVCESADDYHVHDSSPLLRQVLTLVQQQSIDLLAFPYTPHDHGNPSRLQLRRDSIRSAFSRPSLFLSDPF